MILLIDFIRSIISSYYVAIKQVVVFVLATVMSQINYVEGLVVDTFDTFLYYIMNLVLLAFLFVDLMEGWYGDISEKIGIVVTGYNSGFFSKIN